LRWLVEPDLLSLYTQGGFDVYWNRLLPKRLPRQRRPMLTSTVVTIGDKRKAPGIKAMLPASRDSARPGDLNCPKESDN
jgi:hypothetical protein